VGRVEQRHEQRSGEAERERERTDVAACEVAAARPAVGCVPAIGGIPTVGRISASAVAAVTAISPSPPGVTRSSSTDPIATTPFMPTASWGHRGN